MSAPPGCPLSARQWELLELLAQGHDRAGIAQRLGIGESTVRSHLSAVYRTLGVANAAAAVTEAHRRGWVGGGEQVQELRATIAELQKEIEVLRDENDDLHFRIAELENTPETTAAKKRLLDEWELHHGRSPREA